MKYLIFGLLVYITLKIHKMATDFTAIEAEVAENTSVVESAITLLNDIKARLDAAGTDPVKLKELSDTLDQNSNKLAAAVAANTPADEEPPAEEDPEANEENV